MNNEIIDKHTIANEIKDHKQKLLQLQKDLITFQIYVANAHNDGDWESEQVEEIQNTINLIDSLI